MDKSPIPSSHPTVKEAKLSIVIPAGVLYSPVHIIAQSRNAITVGIRPFPGTKIHDLRPEIIRNSLVSIQRKYPVILGDIDAKLLLSRESKPRLYDYPCAKVCRDLCSCIRTFRIDHNYLIGPQDRLYGICYFLLLVKGNYYGRNLHAVDFRRVLIKLK